MGQDDSTDKARWMRDLLDRFEVPLVRYTLKITGDLDRARDVVQEAFLRLCREPRERVEPRLPAWLFTVARNRALDVMKKEKRMKTIGDPGAVTSREPAPARRSEERESARMVLAALGSLPEAQREVIRLKFQNGLSYREIGEVTGHSVSNVGYLIHTAIQSLRRKVKHVS